MAGLPQLQPPPLPAAAGTARCLQGSSSASSSSGVISTMDLQGVLRFYGEQLERAGWLRARSDSSVAGSWRKVNGGDTAVATLVVSGPTLAGAACRLLGLELHQNFPLR